MKFIATFLISALLLASCSSSNSLTHDQRRAQRKLRKAIRLDPNIIANQYTDTTLHGIVHDTVAIATPGFQSETDGFNCDSINQVLTSMLSNAKENEAKMYLYRDSLIDIIVKKDKSGKLSIKADVKPQIKNVPVTTPYDVNVRVPGKVVTVDKRYPFYTYWQFWLASAIAIVFVYLYLSQIRGKNQVNVTLNNPTNGKDI